MIRDHVNLVICLDEIHLDLFLKFLCFDVCSNDYPCNFNFNRKIVPFPSTYIRYFVILIFWYFPSTDILLFFCFFSSQWYHLFFSFAYILNKIVKPKCKTSFIELVNTNLGGIFTGQFWDGGEGGVKLPPV